MTDAIKRTTIDKDKILKEASDFEDLYSDLVWYARKPPLDDPEQQAEYWADCKDEDIRRCCEEVCKRLEEKYPEECKKLRDPDTAVWEHGFNSGSLAAFRWMLHSFDDMLYAETANDWYPNLDT